MRTAFDIAEPGAALGEVAFIFGVRQHATLVARERTIALALTRADYKSVVGEFVGEARRVQGNVLEHVRARGSTSDASAEELRELIEQRKQGALFDLLNAASEGHAEVVKSLLGGQDAYVSLEVNESDYDQRTALHVAVCRDQSKAVSILLAHGASAHVKDLWNNSPIDDAKRLAAVHTLRALAKDHGVPQARADAGKGKVEAMANQILAKVQNMEPDRTHVHQALQKFLALCSEIANRWPREDRVRRLPQRRHRAG